MHFRRSDVARLAPALRIEPGLGPEPIDPEPIDPEPIGPEPFESPESQPSSSLGTDTLPSQPASGKSHACKILRSSHRKHQSPAEQRKRRDQAIRGPALAESRAAY
jgi:hypothetical protein